MRILGLDYGDRRIGLALSDPLLMIAQPLGVYEIKSPKENQKYFSRLIDEYGISEIVIGLPLQMDGVEGERVEKTRKFGDWLEKAVAVPVVYWDERLSTKEALSILHERETDIKGIKAAKDRISACIILSGYLENKRYES